jgi:hypothetical protein
MRFTVTVFQKKSKGFTTTMSQLFVMHMSLCQSFHLADLKKTLWLLVKKRFFFAGQKPAAIERQIMLSSDVLALKIQTFAGDGKKIQTSPETPLRLKVNQVTMNSCLSKLT